MSHMRLLQTTDLQGSDTEHTRQLSFQQPVLEVINAQSRRTWFQYTSSAGQSTIDEHWITCLISPEQFEFEPWSQILKSPGVIVIGKTLDQHDPRYILGIGHSYKELFKLYDLALDVLSPEEAWKGMRISLKGQENAKTEHNGEKSFMERRALIVLNLAKALLASGSITFVRYVGSLSL